MTYKEDESDHIHWEMELHDRLICRTQSRKEQIKDPSVYSDCCVMLSLEYE